MRTIFLDGKTLRRMLIGAALNIKKNIEYINELNVFPVPDGDTGTNMSLTMLSAAKEVSACQSNKMEAICDAVGHTFCCPEPFSHPDSLSAVAFVITIIGYTVRSKVNILPIFKLGTDMLLGSMLKAD